LSGLRICGCIPPLSVMSCIDLMEILRFTLESVKKHLKFSVV